MQLRTAILCFSAMLFLSSCGMSAAEKKAQAEADAQKSEQVHKDLMNGNK